MLLHIHTIFYAIDNLCLCRDDINNKGRIIVTFCRRKLWRINHQITLNDESKTNDHNIWTNSLCNKHIIFGWLHKESLCYEIKFHESIIGEISSWESGNHRENEEWWNDSVLSISIDVIRISLAKFNLAMKLATFTKCK